MSTDQKEREEHLTTPELKTGIDRRATKKKLGRGVLAGASATAVALTAGFVYAFMPKGDTVSAGPNPSETVATGPAVPGTQETTPSPSASAPETTPAVTPELPFDAEAAEALKEVSVKEFYSRPRSEQRNYYLADAYYQQNESGEYGHLTNQVLISGVKAYDYNPFARNGALSRNADPQAIVDAYMYNQAYLMAHDDPDEAEKLVAGMVFDTDSRAGKSLREFAREHAKGVPMAEETAADKDFNKVLDVQKKPILDKETGEKVPGLIITTKRVQYVFAFVEIEGLADNDFNDENDGTKAGLWPNVSWSLR